MDTSIFKELVVLADLKSFSKTAEKLFITQSALSKHVSSAEKEAGFKIFDRSTTHVELTESGKIFIEYAREAVDMYNLALNKGKNSTNTAPETVRLVGPLLNNVVMRLILAACDVMRAKGVEVEMQYSDTGVRDTVGKITSYQADIAVGFRYSGQNQEVLREHILDVPFGIVCREDHRLAKREQLTFEDVVGEEIISYPLDDRKEYHEHVSHVFTKHGISTDMMHLDNTYFSFPNLSEAIIFGAHCDVYSFLFGKDYVVRALDDTRDAFSVDAIRRVNESNPVICMLYDVLVDLAKDEVSVQ